MTPDKEAALDLVDWLRLPLDGKQRQRQATIAQQADRVTVTLRYGERYTFAVTRQSLAEAAAVSLTAAKNEEP